MFKPEVGKCYKLSYGKNDWNNKLIHVRAIVDEDWFVYRWWSRHKKRWRYTIEINYMFKLWQRDKCLTEKGRSKY